ncbi:MAG: EamA family transporter [Candidatus Eremiobacteraeota bacterium]|nr:EamA family transporter [Candidatus Eremiobacteraeota bacterium]
MNVRTATVLAYIFMCSIWGTTWLAIKIGLQYLPPIAGAGLRFVVAGLVLYAVAVSMRKLPVRGTMPWKLIVLLATFLFGLNYMLTYTAETRLSSGLVAVLFGVLPFFMFAMGHYLIGERTTVRTWIGALLAFAGVAVISLAGDVRGSFWFALAAIGAAASSAFANVYAKRHSDVDPIVVLPPAMLLAGVVMTILGAIVERPDVSRALLPQSIGAVLYLAVFGSGIAFFLNLWLLQRIEAWIVGLSALIIPVLAVIVGIVFGGEAFGVRELAGAAFVIAGVWIALAREKNMRIAPDGADTYT